MPDRDKVIKALDEHLHCSGRGKSGYCPYSDDELWNDISDALTMLKEQEPVAPILRPSIKGLAWHCGSCDWKMIEMPDTVTYENTKGSISYCANCGRAVKWYD